MTREHWEKILPIIQAFVDGKKIEFREIEKNWKDLAEPNFTDNPENYRIKIE